MRELNSAKPRDINIDIVKTLAIISVIGIHFFAYINTYGSDTALGKTVWLELICTQLFSFCVPLFLLATGYLMSKKVPSLNYFKKISGILFVYLITSIFYQIFRLATSGEPATLGGIIRPILNLEGSQYSWYVEMYIGLFLLIPFLNIIWHHLKAQKSKSLFCAALFLICSAPHISIKGIHLPDYWLGLWPIMYYYLGAYIKEFNFKIILQKRLILLFLSFGWVCLVAICAVNSNNGVIPPSHILNEWSYPWIALYSVATFSLIISFKRTQHLPKALKSGFTKIASLTLAIYLSSAVFDIIIHRIILKTGSNPVHDFSYFVVAVPLSFIGAFIIAWLIDISWKIISKPRKKLKTTEEI